MLELPVDFLNRLSLHIEFFVEFVSEILSFFKVEKPSKPLILYQKPAKVEFYLELHINP